MEKYRNWLDQYIRGELPTSKFSELKSALKDSPELQEEYSLLIDLNQEIKKSSDSKLKQLLQEEEKSISASEGIVRKLPMRWIGIAASIVVLLGAVFIWQNNAPINQQDSFQELFIPYPNDYVTIERGTNQIAKPQRIFLAYESAQYQEALDLLIDYDPVSANPQLSFYKAMCMLATGKEQAAIAVLENLPRIPAIDPNAKPWFLGLAYMKIGDKATATKKFQAVLDGKSPYQKTNAEKLLKELQK